MDTKLFHEGEPASLFFINFKGSLVKIKAKEVRTITPGISFGQEALVANSLRGASVKAKTDATLLCIFGEAYRNAMEVSNSKGLEQRVEIIKRIYLFSKNYLNFNLDLT
jgi:CRP-like cAMP-binding protein